MKSIKITIQILILLISIISWVIISINIKDVVSWYVILLNFILLSYSVSAAIMWINMFSIWWDKQLLSTHYNKLKDNQFKQS